MVNFDKFNGDINLICNVLNITSDCKKQPSMFSPNLIIFNTSNQFIFIGYDVYDQRFHVRLTSTSAPHLVCLYENTLELINNSYEIIVENIINYGDSVDIKIAFIKNIKNIDI